MISLYDFILKYYNKPIDFDGAYGNQCMDLYRQYVKECLEFPQSLSVIGAADVWDNYPEDHYTKIPNAPSNFPMAGDIVIWSRAYGPYGHIAVAVLADAKMFISFDQNLPLESYCHLQHHSYQSVLGWLRPYVEG